MKKKNVWKKGLVLGAGVLMIIAAFSPTINAPVIKVSNTSVLNETGKGDYYDKVNGVKTATFNDKTHVFDNIIKTAEDSGLLNEKQKTVLKEYNEKLLNMRFSEVKEIAYKQISEMDSSSDSGLSKDEMKDLHDVLIREMEACGVTDEMSFLEVLQLSFPDGYMRCKLGGGISCLFAAVFGMGYGWAECEQCWPLDLPPHLEGCIAFGYIDSAKWIFKDDWPDIIKELIDPPFKPFTNVYDLLSQEPYYIEGFQIGNINSMFGGFLMAGLPINDYFITFVGVALFVGVAGSDNEEIENGSEYNKKDFAKHNFAPLFIKHDITGIDADYLKYHIEKSLKLSSKSSYIPHDPIHINGNDDFKKPVEESGVVGGSGTIDHPYIIENWEINAESATGILIENTDAHFTINNCYIYDGGANDNDGIVFKKVRNGSIINCNVSNNDDGIFLQDSTNNKVTNCTVLRNELNIYLSKAKNNEVIGCTSKGSSAGIWNYYYSSNNNIINCDFQNNLFGMTLALSSSNNNITGCNISHNYFCGIFSIFSSDNNINYNSICKNAWLGMLAAGSIEDATNNWWGSPDGPSGMGLGNGDWITWVRGSIAFDPWLTNPI